MTNNECPCINCVCIPICRHKYWNRMRFDCSLITDYMKQYDIIVPYSRGKSISDALNPTKWKLNEKGHIVTSLLVKEYV